MAATLALRPATQTGLLLIGIAASLALDHAAPQRNAITVNVATTAEFRAALDAARPGTTIAVRPGIYEGGSYRAGLTGTAEAPIVIRGSDPSNPPIFRGGGAGLQLSDARHVVLSDLVFERAADNGINIDDGDTFETPSAHIHIRRVTVRDLPDGNHDGIKLSGVTDFVIEDSHIERWGAGGSGVDMVGCHRGTIRNSTFRHAPGLEFGNGIEAKGGSSAIAIVLNRFEHASSRAVQIGGTTGRHLFRPQPAEAAEARDVTVEDNVIVGGEAAIAFVGSDGGAVRYNTIYLPAKWPIRILQEQTGLGVAACRNGAFTDNVVYWRGDQMINVGAGTEASTFTFARNWWYRADDPARSRMATPAAERDGVYGSDPRFVAPPRDLRPRDVLRAGAFAPRPPRRLPG